MNNNIKTLVIAALFTAMTTVFILFIRIPNPTGIGIIHLGDSVIYLAACILPKRYAVPAAGLGGALANALGGHFIFIIPTLLIKMLISVPFTSESDKILTKRNILMTIPAGLVTIIGYFIVVWVLFDLSGAVAYVLGDVGQAAGSAVIFIIFATALDKIKFKQLLRR